jgi:hypothetical protein
MTPIFNPLSGIQLNEPDKLKQLNRLCYQAREAIQTDNRAHPKYELDFSHTTKWDLITKYIINAPNVEEILNISDTSVPHTAKNKIYEALWDILVKFNMRGDGIRPLPILNYAPSITY